MKNHEPISLISVEDALAPRTEELTSLFVQLRDKFNVANPADLPQDNEDVASAMEDQYEWDVLVDDTARRFDTPESAVEASYLKSVFFTDAGFNDKMYVIEVLDWIGQDYQHAKEMGFTRLASRIESKMKDLSRLYE